MKKIVCAVLVFVFAFSLSVAAFAGDSVIAPVSDGEATSALPEIVSDPAGDKKVELVDADGNAVELTDDALIMLSVADAEESLEGEDLENVKKAYEAAKAEKDYVVTNFFWLDLSDEYKEIVAEGGGLKVDFKVPGLKPGDKVKIMVNGVEIPAKNITVNADGSVTVVFYEFGAVAIMTKAAK